MLTIDFSKNWNNKLHCNCFTTIRLHNPRKYQIGNILLVTLNKEPLKKVVIKDIKKIKLSQVNKFISYIDTGYSVEEFKKIIKSMYKKIPDIENKDFDFILFETIV